MYKKTIGKIDEKLIHFLRLISLPLARFSLFLIFFWFGLLKVIGASPASGMVLELLNKTLPYLEPSSFLIFFGLFEMLIGITFIIPRLERLAIALLFVHLITTVLPLMVLPHITWTAPFVPTMEGQYIIKNILIAAIAVGIAAHLEPKKL